MAEAGRAKLDNLQVTDESNGGLRKPPRAEVSEMNSQATSTSPLRKRTIPQVSLVKTLDKGSASGKIWLFKVASAIGSLDTTLVMITVSFLFRPTSPQRAGCGFPCVFLTPRCLRRGNGVLTEQLRASDVSLVEIRLFPEWGRGTGLLHDLNKSNEMASPLSAES